MAAVNRVKAWHQCLVTTLLLCIICTTVSEYARAGIKSPFGIKAQPWHQLEPAFQAWINLLVPVSCWQPPGINDGAWIRELVLPDSLPLKKNGKKINKISYISCYPDNRTGQPEKQDWLYFMLLEFSSGKVECYPLDTGQKEGLIRLLSLMYSCGMTVDCVIGHKDVNREVFTQDKIIEQLPQVMGMTSYEELPAIKERMQSILKGRQVSATEAVYRPVEISFYQWLHPMIAQLAYAHLVDHPTIYSRALQSGLYLIALGCGSGDDLHTAQRYFQEKNIQTCATGIEIRPDLIRKARAKLPGCHFICGNARNACQLIRQARQQNPLPEKAPTLVLAEGLLSRQVLKGTYEAVQVLHQFLQEQETDLIVAATYSTPLISQEIMTASHWQGQIIMIKVASNLLSFCPSLMSAFLLSRQSLEQQVRKVRERSLERSASGEFTTLDLSMSGHPLTIMDTILKDISVAMNITQVDLSYSHIGQSQVIPLINRLLGVPRLQQVLVSGYEPWYGNFFEETRRQARTGIALRQDNQYFYDLPTFSPKVARALKQYDEVPYKNIFRPETLDTMAMSSPSGWTDDIEVSGLAPPLLKTYREALLSLLSHHHLQLVDNVGDNVCFFHAVAPQLGMEQPQLVQALILNLLSHQQVIQQLFPSFQGEQFNLLLGELQENAWAEPRVLQLISFLFNKKAALIYFDLTTGEVRLLVYLPDGTVLNQLPEAGISDDDIIVVHNGERHYLAATINMDEHDLLAQNQFTLNPPPIDSPILTPSGSWLATALISLLMWGWNQIAGYKNQQP